MSLTLRHYLFPEDADPVRLSQRLTDGLVAGTDWLPDYANTRQRVLTVFLENMDGKPVKMLGQEASIWTFDEAGGIREGQMASMSEVIDSFPSAPSSDGTVVSLARPCARNGWRRAAAGSQSHPTSSWLLRTYGLRASPSS